jgi:uncharacterized protein (TIGR03437 family)
MRTTIPISLSYALFLTNAVASAPASQMLSRLPLRFEEHRSAARANELTYIAHGGDFDLVVRPAESWIARRGGRVRMKLGGANPHARMEALDRLPGTANYFLGREKSWKTDVTGYGRIRSENVYPGIDLIFHGEGGRLEYDFNVAPLADPGLIRLEFTGQRLRVDPEGDLIISTGADETRWKRPEIYQDVNGRRVPVDGRFVVSRGRVRFETARYDRSKELVIDPTLSYSTYLGGSGNEGARGIALDGSGNIYIAGNTTSSNLSTISAYQPNFGGETASYLGGDAFVAKFNSSGALVYLTYLGGSADDAASALAVDAAGNAYITGQTTSTNFPVVNPYQSTFGGSGTGSIIRTGDAFVAKLSPTGNHLIYSTYLGGGQDDAGTAIAIDSTGNAYVTGATQSVNFPVTSGVYQGHIAGVGGEPIKPCCGLPSWDPGDAFIAKLDPTGSTLIFSTFLGGTSDDLAFTIALDSSNNIYVGGCTLSSDFPTTPGALQRVWGGIDGQNEFLNTGDGFVTKLNPTGTALIYSTLFGGPGDDCVSAIAVDSSSNVYMTGSTSSANLPATAGAFQPSYKGYFALPFNIEHLYGDAFVAKLNPSGSALVYMSYLGGSANDGGTALAIDGAGNAYVTGFSDSEDFPLASALQSKMAGDGGQAALLLYGDAFLSVVNPTGTALLYSSYFGGSLDDVGFGLALDTNGNVYIAGETVSSNLPTTSNAAQKAFGGEGTGNVGFVKGDAFLATFSGLVSAAPAIVKVANAEGESLTIAPNTWVEIKGSGLAPDTRTWQPSDFVNSQLPTMLDGVTVTMNGENAFVYYISGVQVNVLTPPDLKAGPVSVVVSNKGSASTAFSAQAQATSESFFIFNGGPYVVATHLNGSLIGPATLYPGLSTPAQSGETIIIYANGFGATTAPVVSGAETQSGSLPSLPAVQIGGKTATVTFAGLITPGLYQFNVVVPSSLPSGDNAIQASYTGQTTQAGTLLTIQ